MWTLQLLGELSAYSQQRNLIRFRTQKAASLLAYLAYHSAPQPRDVLISMLWPEAETEVGRHNLSMALSFLRHRLEPPGVPPGSVIQADRFSVRMRPEAVTSDVASFERLARAAGQTGASEAERLELLLQAADLYKGPLLPGFHDDWIAPQVTRLESLFAQVVGQLTPLLLERGRHETALTYAQRASSADPLSEEAALNVMQALAALGQSGRALRVYRALEQRLRVELNSEPSKALRDWTRRLTQSPSTFAVSAPPETEAPADHALSSPGKTEGEARALALEAAESAPPGRLLGAEFLLRTTTRFFGREEETARLIKLLSTPRTRLVTLTGPGGTGKTRLAIEAAAHLVESATHTPAESRLSNAAFVPLADVTQPERLFDVMLRCLGKPPASDRDSLEHLASLLNSRPNTLLILDNFEQLAEDGALRIKELLGLTADVKFLVTSRQTLRVEGERVFHLAPLPTSAGTQTPEALLAVPSIALFVDRAQYALPYFQLTERNAAPVAQLCDYLEGLPLAIELAAARVSVLTPARILEQAQSNRLDFLATHRRDAGSRQRTLRTTLDWSYHLLPEAGRQAICALSVFRGGWTLEAAQAVGGLSESDALDALMLLRDSSLIGVADAEDGLRYIMLETIREYCRYKLMEAGRDAEVCMRHRDFFLALAEEAETLSGGPDQGQWLARLAAEHENLCSAVAWCEADENGADAGLRLAAGMARFWEVRGYLSLGRSYLVTALNRAGAAGPTPERAKALYGAGILAYRLGDFEAARTLTEESLTIKRALRDKRGMVSALNSLGNFACSRSDYSSARKLYEEGLTIARELGDRQGIAKLLNNLGVAAYEQGDYEPAGALHEESLAIRRELGNRYDIAYSLQNLGNMAHERRDYALAGALHEESLAIRRELGDTHGIAFSLQNLGNMAREQGDYSSAGILLEESLAITRELGDKQGIAYSLHNLGNLAHEQGDHRLAKARHLESLPMLWELEDRRAIAFSLQACAGLSASEEQPKRAARLWGFAEVLLEETGSPLSADERDRYDREVTAVRQELGETAFGAAWAEGRTMTLDQAVAYALEEASLA